MADAIFSVPEGRGARDGAGMSAAGVETLRAYFAGKGTRAALVVRRGLIVAEWYWDGANAQTLFPCYSVTKSIASVAVGLLVDDGVIGLEESAAKYIPAWREDERAGVTVRHLLSMTSGIQNDWEGMQQVEDRTAYAIRLPLVAPPGTTFDYTNCAYLAIGAVIRAASGVGVADFLQQRLYGPLGMTGPRHAMGAANPAHAGLHLTARDAARFGCFFLRRGVWNGHRILSERWIDQACRSSQDLNPDYGFLWWVNTRGLWPSLPRDAYSAHGLYENNVTILPSHDLVLVRLVGDAARNTLNTDVSVDEYGALAVAACAEA